MSFELYKNKRSSYHSMITIRKYIGFYLNVSCVDRFLKNGKYAELFYDIKKKIIGIKPVNNSIDGYKITYQKSGAIIGAKCFISHYHIICGRFPATWNEKEKLIEIKLNKEKP